MANLLVYLIHPSPDSLNAATATSIVDGLTADGHRVQLRNLYQLDFDPRLGLEDFTEQAAGNVPAAVRAEQEAISAADGLLFVYPTWWWERPAMLKGFCDRILTKGFAWEYGENGVEGLLGSKRVFAAVTHGGPRELYESFGVEFDRFHDAFRVGTLGFCGMTDLEIFSSYGVPMYASDERVPHVAEATEAARKFFTPDATA